MLGKNSKFPELKGYETFLNGSFSSPGFTDTGNLVKVTGSFPRKIRHI